MKTFIVTGATRGLGLEIARALAVIPDTDVVLAVRDATKGAEVARALGKNVRVLPLDLSDLTDVRRFASAWTSPLAGLVNNAGVQETTGTGRTKDGLELTIGTNHIGAFALTEALLPSLMGGRVMFIGSGTHNPAKATEFGFRGGRFTSIEALARGDTDAADEGQANRDRYATSKLLNTMTAMEWARRIPTTTFLTLDPGLMPGTGLARKHSLPMRIIWSSLLHLVAPLILKDSSTATRSGRAAAWLMIDPSVVSGEVYSFDRKPSQQVWEKARDPQLMAAVIDQTSAFLRGHGFA